MMNEDILLDQMEQTRFKKRHSLLVRVLTRYTHFSGAELESVMLIHYKLTRDGPMDRKRFREILHSALDMTGATLHDRIFSVLDKGADLVITMQSWSMAMSLFLRGTQEELIKYCFAVYDILGDGLIGKETMFLFMKNAIIKHPQDEDADEGVKDLVDVILKKMDLDRDGKISFNDFRATCTRLPLLMECLGKCIPSRKAVQTFLTTFTPNYGRA